MHNKSSEQFDVLSNTLRVLPEQVFRLNYLINEVKDPEEAITNVEIACVNVFNQIYGMMCTLKEDGFTESIYKHEAINTILCIRHVLQHQSGRIKNNMRDAIHKNLRPNTVLVKYSASDKNFKDFPFFINIKWMQESIQNSNNSKRLPLINKYWNLDKIEYETKALNYCWDACYICVMSIITESVRLIIDNYGKNFKPVGFDSEVYYGHFAGINPIDPNDYGFSVLTDVIKRT